MNAWTGFGTSRCPPRHPGVRDTRRIRVLWAIGIGLAAALLGNSSHRWRCRSSPSSSTRRSCPHRWSEWRSLASRSSSPKDPTEVPRRSSSPGRTLPTLIQQADTWTVGRSIARRLQCLASALAAAFPAVRPFLACSSAPRAAARPIFRAANHRRVAMGIGAMTVAMLGFPLTSVLIVAILLPADAVPLLPLVIVAVVVSYVTSRVWRRPRRELSASAPSAFGSPGVRGTSLPPGGRPRPLPGLDRPGAHRPVGIKRFKMRTVGGRLAGKVSPSVAYESNPRRERTGMTDREQLELLLLPRNGSGELWRTRSATSRWRRYVSGSRCSRVRANAGATPPCLFADVQRLHRLWRRRPIPRFSAAMMNELWAPPRRA